MFHASTAKASTNGQQESERQDSPWDKPKSYELQELEREVAGIIHLSKFRSEDQWQAFQGSECDELYYNLGQEDGHMRERLIKELRRVAIWHLEYANELEETCPIPDCRCTGVLTREYRVNYYEEPRSVWLCDQCAEKGGVA